MKYSTISTLAILAGGAVAAPVAAPIEASVEKRQSANIDPVVLQFALTLEHLENVFYKGAIEKFCEEDFVKAGYSARYYNNLKYIAYDEETHVTFLTTALKAANVTPNAACTYSFPYTDVQSFITLSSVLEGVGVSAYTGGAGLITNKAYLTAAASILAVEAEHTAMQRGALKEVPAANPFATPLDPTSVYTLAAAFIKSCPATNMALPFTPFPGLTYTPASSPAMAGSTISLTAAASSIPAGSFVTFVSGLSVVSVPGTIKGASISAAVPHVAQGQTYVFVTKSDVETTFSDSAVLFGPAIVEVTPAPPTINYSIL